MQALSKDFHVAISTFAVAPRKQQVCVLKLEDGIKTKSRPLNTLSNFGICINRSSYSLYYTPAEHEFMSSPVAIQEEPNNGQRRYLRWCLKRDRCDG